ncbi:hypothetical protein SDC9_125610 [bioreactor metagenome]|uniref:Hcy-binding domain-containing protein n=1 Tax=bioreactor metagenome TaxID=1076179 RepID=A0A645CNX2_9ZZZZ
MNKEGAALARRLCDEFTAANPAKPRFVAGVLGPTSRTASISPDVNDPGYRNVSFDELVTDYVEAIRGLTDGGADILLVETVFDTLNAKAALFAIEQFFDARSAFAEIQVPQQTFKPGRSTIFLRRGVFCDAGFACIVPTAHHVALFVRQKRLNKAQRLKLALCTDKLHRAAVQAVGLHAGTFHFTCTYQQLIHAVANKGQLQRAALTQVDLVLRLKQQPYSSFSQCTAHAAFCSV